MSRSSVQPDEVLEYSTRDVEAMIHYGGCAKVKLGEGASATVYIGVVSDERTVAVKRIDPSFEHGHGQFLNEVKILRRANHANVVTLLGYCPAPGKMALIYEYAEEGSLHDHIFGKRGNLVWIVRLRILVEAARGIEYLHNGCRPTIYHRDIKSKNILLFSTGDKMVAKVADFGVSKSLGSHRGDHSNYGKTHVSTMVVGTRGHLDPEYFSSGHMKDKSDVFSFGVLIQELITGRESLVFTKSEAGTSAQNIVEWVKSQKAKDLPDKYFGGKYNQDSMTEVIKLAKACVQSPSTSRPDMRVVLRELEGGYEKESAHQAKVSAGKTHSKWSSWWRRS